MGIAKKQRIVFVNMHSNVMLVRTAGSIVFKQSNIAISWIHYLRILLSKFVPISIVTVFLLDMALIKYIHS